jgi:hypothetical protein
MTENEPNDYYTAQISKLLKAFDRRAKRYRKVLASHAENGAPEGVIREAREEWQRLIPEIPYIGGKRTGFTSALIECTMHLALYRALKARGKRAEEIGKIVVEVEENRVQTYPGLLRRLMGRGLLSRFGEKRLRRIAEESQKRLYAGGWVATFVEGDGNAFDFGIDYTECGLCKFFHQQRADEFTRYLCLFDYVQQGAMKTGFSRSMTLAEGADRCDFRWKKGGETRPAWPPPW